MTPKARIAHLAGPNATIQNTPPLVTSNKARAKHHQPLLTDPEGKPARFDVLRPQRFGVPEVTHKVRCTRTGISDISIGYLVICYAIRGAK